MADITMCPGIKCPAKEVCYRYSADRNYYRQSYFVNTPLKGFGKDTKGKTVVYCDYFYEFKEIPNNLIISKNDYNEK